MVVRRHDDTRVITHAKNENISKNRSVKLDAFVLYLPNKCQSARFGEVI